MDVYQSLCKAILKPIKLSQKKCEQLSHIQQLIKKKQIMRIDLSVLNRNDKHLSGFLFYQPNTQPQDTILYLHGYGGNKFQALPLVQFIPQFKINVVAFDFLGCKQHQSEIFTYGINQVSDIRDILQQVRKYTHLGRLTLWGRNMGALCSLMFAQIYSYEVDGLILDSPFRNLTTMINRMVLDTISLPQLLLKPLLYILKKQLAKQLKCNIFEIDYISILKKLNPNISILFILSYFNGIVPVEQIFEFYNCYKGVKDFYEIYETYHEQRNYSVFYHGVQWIKKNKRKNIQAIIQAREYLFAKNKRQNEFEQLC